MANLVEYFQNRQAASTALERYYLFSEKNNWDIRGDTGKIRLYSLMLHAEDPSTPKVQSGEDFATVYEIVRNWPGVERGGQLAPAEQVFDILVNQGCIFFYGSSGNLGNLKYPSSLAKDIRSFLPFLDFIKPTENYPWMPVSKVLHFVNPGLFPIWDTKIVWNKVMYPTSGAFGDEYSLFCKTRNFNKFENGSIFVLNYVLWAAHYIQRRDPAFMDWFTDWMESHFSDDLARYNFTPHLQNLYATAFEFVAIGAAHLEQGE
jgi:hypothetical protein